MGKRNFFTPNQQRFLQCHWVVNVEEKRSVIRGWRRKAVYHSKINVETISTYTIIAACLSTFWHVFNNISSIQNWQRTFVVKVLKWVWQPRHIFSTEFQTIPIPWFQPQMAAAIKWINQIHTFKVFKPCSIKNAQNKNPSNPLYDNSQS